MALAAPLLRLLRWMVAPRSHTNCKSNPAAPWAFLPPESARLSSWISLTWRLYANRTPSGGASPSRRAGCDTHHSECELPHTESETEARGPTLNECRHTKSHRRTVSLMQSNTRRRAMAATAHRRKISRSVAAESRPMGGRTRRRWPGSCTPARSFHLSRSAAHASAEALPLEKADALHPSRTCTVFTLKQCLKVNKIHTVTSSTDSMDDYFCNSSKLDLQCIHWRI